MKVFCNCVDDRFPDRSICEVALGRLRRHRGQVDVLEIAAAGTTKPYRRPEVRGRFTGSNRARDPVVAATEEGDRTDYRPEYNTRKQEHRDGLLEQAYLALGEQRRRHPVG